MKFTAKKRTVTLPDKDFIPLDRPATTRTGPESVRQWKVMFPAEKFAWTVWHDEDSADIVVSCYDDDFLVHTLPWLAGNLSSRIGKLTHRWAEYFWAHGPVAHFHYHKAKPRPRCPRPRSGVA